MPDEVKMGMFGKLAKFLAHVADPILDGLVVLGLISRTAEGKIQVKPETIREHAPRMSKKAEHESRWAAIIAKLTPQDRNAILMHFMRQLHEEQQADLIQSAADASQIGPDGEKCVLEHLRHIAQIPYHPLQPGRQQQERIAYADSLNWIKDNPDEYWVVRLQRFAGRRFHDLEDLCRWLNDPNGPVIQLLEQHTTQAQAHTAQLRVLRQNIAQPPQPPYSWDPAVRHAQRNRGRLSRWFHDRFGI